MTGCAASSGRLPAHIAVYIKKGPAHCRRLFSASPINGRATLCKCSGSNARYHAGPRSTLGVLLDMPGFQRGLMFTST